MFVGGVTRGHDPTRFCERDIGQGSRCKTGTLARLFAAFRRARVPVLQRHSAGHSIAAFVPLALRDDPFEGQLGSPIRAEQSRLRERVRIAIAEMAE